MQRDLIFVLVQDFVVLFWALVIMGSQKLVVVFNLGLLCSYQTLYSVQIFL